MSVIKSFFLFTLLVLIVFLSQSELSTASTVENDVETAFGLYSTGLWDDTIRFLRGTIEKITSVEKKETAVYVLADSYRRLKNYSEAITWYRRYTEEFVGGKYYAMVLYDSAWIYYEQNKLKEAEVLVTTLLKFLATHPKTETEKIKAKIFLGHILFKQGKFNQVLEVLKQEEQNNNLSRLLFQSLIKLGRYKDAVLFYNKHRTDFKQSGREDLDYLVLYANACFCSGKHKQAEVAYTHAYNLISCNDSKYYHIIYHLAQLAEKRGDNKKAKTLYTEVSSNSKEPTLQKLAKMRLQLIANE
jgi:tetratricopeptide (TPR) repeat protein